MVILVPKLCPYTEFTEYEATSQNVRLLGYVCKLCLGKVRQHHKYLVGSKKSSNELGHLHFEVGRSAGGAVCEG
jgi:hypothetical protein